MENNLPKLGYSHMNYKIPIVAKKVNTVFKCVYESSPMYDASTLSDKQEVALQRLIDLGIHHKGLPFHVPNGWLAEKLHRKLRTISSIYRVLKERNFITINPVIISDGTKCRTYNYITVNFDVIYDCFGKKLFQDRMPRAVLFIKNYLKNLGSLCRQFLQTEKTNRSLNQKEMGMNASIGDEPETILSSVVPNVVACAPPPDTPSESIGDAVMRLQEKRRIMERKSCDEEGGIALAMGKLAAPPLSSDGTGRLRNTCDRARALFQSRIPVVPMDTDRIQRLGTFLQNYAKVPPNP